MEGSGKTMTGHSTVTSTDDEHGEDDEHEERELPEAVVAAKKGDDLTEEQEGDATAWLLESDIPTPDEVEPTEIRLNVGSPAKPKMLSWFVVPLPDAEFRRFRNMAMGSRRQRRAAVAGDLTGVDDWKYHLLVVAAATVKPDLLEIARAKGIADTTDILKHRFAAKPGLVNQISGIVSDISGMDEADAEVVAGNS
jgi:hypothetical protein